MEFEEIYTANFKKILAYILAKTGNRTSAEEICSVTWQKAFANFAQYNPAKGVIEQWLFTIAKNEVKKHYRLKFVKSFLPLDIFGNMFSDGITPDKQYENTLAQQELFCALSKLTEKERDVLTLKHYSGLNNRQIARLTGLSESNVAIIAMRSKNKVKVFLGEENEE